MLSKRTAAAAHSYLLGLFHHGGKSFLRCVLQSPELVWQVLGARAVLPLLAACSTPLAVMPQGVSNTGLGPACSQA